MATDTVEDIPSFDPTMKKKKKKKKTTFDAGEEDQNVPVDDAPAVDSSAPTTSAAATTTTTADASEDAVEDEAEIDFSKQKKKKKKPTKDTTAATTTEDTASEVSVDSIERSDQAEQDAGSDDDGDDGEEDPSQSWLGTDRDYTYNELLSRAFNILDGNNPDSARSKRSRMVMKPPSVFREGTKKTVWANFQEICKLMGRSTDHVMAFSLTELGTSGSVDGSYRLVIKGRFTPKQIESVIKHYITEYVTCRTCKSPETNLKKENRLYFVQCRSCGSTRSVAAIKYGFQAQVGKRKKT